MCNPKIGNASKTIDRAETILHTWPDKWHEPNAYGLHGNTFRALVRRGIAEEKIPARGYRYGSPLFRLKQIRLKE
jgi:hypothetical protein